MTETLYKVTGAHGESCHGGTGKWVKGRWRSVTLPLEPCENGLHVVNEQQLIHWLGPRIGIVEVAGGRIDQYDKTIVERARVTRWLDDVWNERTQRLFAADCAEHVVHLCGDDPRPREAIAVARKYANGEATKAELDAARDAVWVAARDAERDAVWVAARDAARAAVWVAARDSAWGAARDAARDAARAAVWGAALDSAWDAALDCAWAARLMEYLRGER